MNPAEVLARQAESRGHQLALVDRVRGTDRTLTFSGLHAAVESVAGQLMAAGLRPGDRVLVFHPVRLELYVLLLALFRQGMTAVFVDPGQSRAFLSTCCALVQPAAFFGSPRAHLLRLLCPAVRRIPQAFHCAGWVPASRRISWQGSRSAAPPDSPADQPDAPALITFTSGSTGQPRGIARSHRFLMAQHAALESCLALQPGDVDLATLPVFVLANLASGLTTVLADMPPGKPGAADGEKIAAQICQGGVTRTAASPAFFERLLASGAGLAGLRQIYTGGAPVFPGLLQRLTARCPEARVVAVYGSSEAEPIARLAASDISPDDLADMQSGRGLLAGRTVSGLKVAVISAAWGQPLGRLTAAEWESCQCPPDQMGEIVVSGPHVVRGYWNGQGDGETKFHVGEDLWHRTGDAGCFAPDGRLWLAGRCGAAIPLPDGCRLYPFCLETALSFFPEICGSALVQHGGQIVLVVESAVPQVQPEWQALLTRFPVSRVRFLTIPRDKRHNAKVDYPALRRLLDQSGA